jgi:hypothetical protein
MNLFDVRTILFEQLQKIREAGDKPEAEQAKALDQARGVNEICKTILDTAKIEHNFQRMSQASIPYSDFIPYRKEQAVDVYAKLAKETREAWKAANPEKRQQLTEHTNGQAIKADQ